LTAVVIIMFVVIVLLVAALAYVLNRANDCVKHMAKYINARQCDVLSNPTIQCGRERYDELKLTYAKFQEYVKHAEAMPWKH